MNSKTYDFEAVIQKVPDIDGAYIAVPFDIKVEFGKGRAKVRATFDCEPYDGSIVNMSVKNPDGSVCYIIGVRGDMEAFASLGLDYALFPGDGFFNMGPEEATECAELVGAKHNVLIHLKPGESIRKKTEKWSAPNKLIVEPGQEMNL